MNFFKKKQVERRGEGESPVDNGDSKNKAPYLNYRRRWNDHTGSVLAQRNIWMILCLLSLLITLFAVGGLIQIGQQSKFIPYIIEVDKLGAAVAVSPATQAATADVRVIKASIASFINDARMVTPDVELLRKAVFRLYSKLIPGDSATNKMSEHLNGNEKSNPFVRAETQTVSVEIINVIPQTDSTFQVDWIETVRDRQGVLIEKPFRMKALLTVTTITPNEDTSEEKLLENPLGIYVVDYNWSKTL